MQIGGEGLRVKSGHVDSSESSTKWCMMHESTNKHWPKKTSTFIDEAQHDG